MKRGVNVEMYEIKVPISAIRALSNEQRYAYYLLGHMFNELMFLQKLAGFSVSTMTRHSDKRPSRTNPEQAQALFLFRIASAKVWEAVKSIRSDVVRQVLCGDIFPCMIDGESRLKALNVAINSAQWLPAIRNGIGFHYPAFDRWEDFVTPGDDWVDDSVFLSSRSGNVFYDGSDAIVKHWMFRQKSSKMPTDGIAPLIDDMIHLLTETTNFLQEVLGVFLEHLLLEGNGQGKAKKVGKVKAPAYQEVTIPFWIGMPASERDSLDLA